MKLEMKEIDGVPVTGIPYGSRTGVGFLKIRAVLVEPILEP